MPEQITNMRVFLSSPGDVNEERKMALEVLERLIHRPSLREKVSFRPVAWDKPGAGTPMLASISPQEAINAGLPMPSQCDIVVVILWSRMGTPFQYEGVDYHSGTHYELMDALSNPQTTTIIYRRTEKKLFDADDDEGITQYKKVQNFFKSDLFYDPANGRIRRGVNNYAHPAEFKEKFETDLEAIVIRLLVSHTPSLVPAVASPSGAEPTEKERLQKQLVVTKRRLAVLEEQYVGFGSLHAPVHLIIQLEDTREEIADLEKRLQTAQSVSAIPTPPVSSPTPAPVVTPSQPVIKIAEPKPITPDSEREMILREIADPFTSHTHRMQIGDRLSEIGDTRRGVGVRDDGLPDIAWLAVHPGGKLEIEKQTFEIQPFYIAQYQVTFAQYEAFVQAKDGYYSAEWWQGFPKEYQPQELNEQCQKGSSNPRDNISWYRAVAFGRWLNRRMRGWQLPNPRGTGNPLIFGNNAQVRLPTEWEWQWAAQGGDEKRQYPWGAWQEGYANTSEACLKRAVAVGMYRQRAAACGAMDMSGNVWEWCQNKWEKLGEVLADGSGNSRVVRGGSFGGGRAGAFCAYRANSSPGGGGSSFGFRLVVSSPIAGL
ncbi:MAG: SUMF1/EgtB/PvdO family nonheme iron enzyme [Chloroflexi bacterium]|uniref:SUMF1/EgtB/PvdO family nonheme iron enzyme n=1 Tax=Candidatus Chlorohelix allophototropha TaxID=3003348 RepID=A0A8T7M9K1_9CHLR|nr:SUMF1/EgtB/PvdO family nonheme iron enzyme [Chloroflexota bacterium]WJW68742.1 SUMF1/EgtB/PvdO family nonheme iron enzyme [Chloroflexota bacterium L227-S17]